MYLYLYTSIIYFSTLADSSKHGMSSGSRDEPPLIYLSTLVYSSEHGISSGSRGEP